ncbi:MAG: hypothetical protein AAFV07_04385 [Bacteroidota bacterium]
MKRLLAPFTAPARSQSDAYFQHRFWGRLVWEAGQGLRRIADDHAQKIVASHRALGHKIDHRLATEFEEVKTYQREIHSALIDQTQVMALGFDKVSTRLELGFDQVNENLGTVADRVDQVGGAILTTGDRLQQGIKGLSATMDMGMAGIMTQIELQREEMQAGLAQIADILRNSRKTEAQERCEDGIADYERYLKHPDEPAFLEDALAYLNESASIYRGNPYTHLYLGHVHHEAGQFYDLEQAFKHYSACATYAKGLNNRSLAGMGYFMAAWIAYVQGDVDQAIHLGELSEAYDPDGLPENLYNLSKYFARKKDSQAALRYLHTVIDRFDPQYALKANVDADFEPIAGELSAFFVKLKEETAQAWAARINAYKRPLHKALPAATNDPKPSTES